MIQQRGVDLFTRQVDRYISDNLSNGPRINRKPNRVLKNRIADQNVWPK